MFSGSQYDDAYGWSTDTVDDADGDRHSVASKTGGQLGSDAYLQVFPDDNIVIAVLSNSAAPPTATRSAMTRPTSARTSAS